MSDRMDIRGAIGDGAARMSLPDLPQPEETQAILTGALRELEGIDTSSRRGPRTTTSPSSGSDSWFGMISKPGWPLLPTSVDTTGWGNSMIGTKTPAASQA